ncbi:MAG: enoyl-CoA hydratase [Chitinophagales bacterium]|nr:MAG: enoyl-CoA hydratase [Chitinophagales bacterium]
MASVILQEHETGNGKILQITLNRPEVHNCIDGEAAQMLLQAWQRFSDEDDLVVAVLHGAGEEAFCSGADLKALHTLVNVEADQQQQQHFIEHGTGPLGGTRLLQTKPVIAVSQGYTFAGGLELYCHGHIRLAEEKATFSVSCRRWGVPLVDGGTVYLPRLIGLGYALPLIITGQKIDAKRAYEIGLVWEVVPQGKGLERAMEYARQICLLPREAMLADLSSAIHGLHLSWNEALKLEASKMYEVLRGESIRRGVEQFIQGNRQWFK